MLKRLKIWTFNIEGLSKLGRLHDLTAWVDKRNIGHYFYKKPRLRIVEWVINAIIESLFQGVPNKTGNLA